MPSDSLHKKLLLIEDNTARGHKIRACLPTDLECVWAHTARGALGILSREQFQAIMLDYELEGETSEPVAGMIATTQARDCAVMVHSVSTLGGHKLTEILRRAGFPVEHRPWEDSPAGHAAIRNWAEKTRGGE